MNARMTNGVPGGPRISGPLRSTCRAKESGTGAGFRIAVPREKRPGSAEVPLGCLVRTIGFRADRDRGGDRRPESARARRRRDPAARIGNAGHGRRRSPLAIARGARRAAPRARHLRSRMALLLLHVQADPLEGIRGPARDRRRHAGTRVLGPPLAVRLHGRRAGRAPASIPRRARDRTLRARRQLARRHGLPGDRRRATEPGGRARAHRLRLDGDADPDSLPPAADARAGRGRARAPLAPRVRPDAAAQPVRPGLARHGRDRRRLVGPAARAGNAPRRPRSDPHEPSRHGGDHEAHRRAHARPLGTGGQASSRLRGPCALFRDLQRPVRRPARHRPPSAGGDAGGVLARRLRVPPKAAGHFGESMRTAAPLPTCSSTAPTDTRAG